MVCLSCFINRLLLFFANGIVQAIFELTYSIEDGIHVMPKETRKDAPPSYIVVQADAVPQTQ